MGMPSVDRPSVRTAALRPHAGPGRHRCRCSPRDGGAPSAGAPPRRSGRTLSAREGPAAAGSVARGRSNRPLPGHVPPPRRPLRARGAGAASRRSAGCQAANDHRLPGRRGRRPDGAPVLPNLPVEADGRTRHAARPVRAPSGSTIPLRIGPRRASGAAAAHRQSVRQQSGVSSSQPRPGRRKGLLHSIWVKRRSTRHARRRVRMGQRPVVRGLQAGRPVTPCQSIDSVTASAHEDPGRAPAAPRRWLVPCPNEG